MAVTECNRDLLAQWLGEALAAADDPLENRQLHQARASLLLAALRQAHRRDDSGQRLEMKAA